jgi:hypothetical protein
MSQVSIIDIEGNYPQIPTQFNGNVGSAVPIANILKIVASTVAAGTIPIATFASGNTVEVLLQVAQAFATSSVSRVGVASFDDSDFSVDANGFVSLAQSPITILKPDDGVDILPNLSGQVEVHGVAVANSTHNKPLYTSNGGFNVANFELQYAAAIAATDGTKAGIASFDSSSFGVDADGFVTLTAPPSTDLHVSRYIVSAGGSTDGANYTTIASAITAAASAGGNQTIFIQPGVYTENLTLVSGINLCAFVGDATVAPGSSNVVIFGKLTCTYTGTVDISGIELRTNSDFCIESTGTNLCNINLYNCNLNILNNIFLSSSNVNFSFRFFSCTGNVATTGISLYSITSAAVCYIRNCNFTNTGNTATASTSLIATIIFYNSYLGFTFTFTSGRTEAYYTIFEPNAASPCLTLGPSGGVNEFYHCSFLGGSAQPAIITNVGSIIYNSFVQSTNAAAISGSGTLLYAGLTFSGTSTITVTTQSAEVHSNDALKVVSPGAYPYTTLEQDAVILVDSSSARTIIPNSTPNSGLKHIIKDSTGQAGTNPITITPSGKNIDGVASKTINTPYGSIVIVYNGTEWNIISGPANPKTIVTTYNANGSWTINSATQFVDFYATSGAGGGGSGRSGVSGSASGGGGGGAGQLYYLRMSAANLTASPYTVTVGTGGAGGTSVSTALTNGNPGSPGNPSTVGTIIRSPGGTAGAGGTTASGGGGTGGYFSMYAIAGAASGGAGSNGTAGVNGGAVYGWGTGGGGGSGYTNGGATVGGTGAAISDSSGSTIIAGGLLGANTGATAGNGNPPTGASQMIGGTGGGGGGHNGVTTAGNGGNGGAPGGGGGGGAGNLSGSGSGAGGSGAAGRVVIIEYL